jgi:hypothetical protein
MTPTCVICGAVLPTPLDEFGDKDTLMCRHDWLDFIREEEKLQKESNEILRMLLDGSLEVKP